MKYIVTLISVFLVMSTYYSAKAQSGSFTISTSSAVTLDTNVNAAQNELFSPLNSDPIKKYWGITVVATKISGYAKGSANLYGSINGTNWDLIPGVSTTDSLTMSNQTTNKKTWWVKGDIARRYKVVVTTIDSTQSIQIKTNFINAQ